MTRLVTYTLVLGLGALPMPASAQLTDSAAVAEAERFVTLLRAGEWERAGDMVAPSLQNRLGASQLEAVWRQIGVSLGDGPVTRLRRVAPLDTMRSVELYGDFTRDTVLLRIVLSPSGEVMGFWVGTVPDAAPAVTPAPTYADPPKFREAEVRVGAESWVLPGTLSLPVGGGRHPAVVLVHGSGPHGRDQTVGGTSVFRDVAWGLATQGIAVLRYDKRTQVHGERMGSDVTVEEEVIEDALAALELVRAHPGIDPKQVYVAGHSLGAQLAPEIARRDGRVAGAILLAAPARPLADIIEEQLQYLAGLPANAAPEARAGIEEALAQVRMLKSGEAADTQMVMGAPASYFRDLASRDAVAEALRLDIPVLVLQGGRDYQVTMADFEIWREALKDRAAATATAFPELNHLFVAGEGPSTPAEYVRSAHVAEEVVTTIAAWLRTQAKR